MVGALLVRGGCPTLRIVVERLRLNFLTARWQILAALLFLLGSFSLFESIESYARRLHGYRADLMRHAVQSDSPWLNMYLAVKVSLDRPPEPLGVLAPGTREEFGSCAVIGGQFAPTVVSSRERVNPFLAEQEWGDLTGVIGIVGSLLAVLLTADAISGSREEGTLQVLLSQPVTRWQVLLGEYFGGFLSASLPLVLCWGVVLLTYGLHPDLGLDATSLPALIGMLVISLFYMSVWVLAGLLVSVRTSETATSMTAALVIWLGMGIVLPDAVLAAVRFLRPVEDLADLTAQDVVSASSFGVKNRESDVPSAVRAENMRERVAQASRGTQLERISPLACYRQCCEALASSDIEAHLLWLQNVGRFEDVFIRWQKDKVAKYPQRVNYYSAADPPLDLSGLPRAERSSERLSSRFARALPPLAVLLALNLLLFSGSYVSIIRYDPRYN